MHKGRPDIPEAAVFIEVSFPVTSAEVEAVEVHDFGPCCHEVMHELFLCVVASVDFRNSAEPGVRAENEIGAGGSPPWFTGFAVTALERLMLFRERFPLRAHVEQVDEEIM